MRKVTFDLPGNVFVRNVKGEAINWNVEATPDNVLRDILIRGGLTVLTNCFNGGGKDGSESEKLAALQKKLDGWYAGEFSRVERGESQYTAMREAYVADCVAAGLTTKQADAGLKALIVDQLGNDAKATFANFIEAESIRREKAKEGTRADLREAIEAYYAKRVSDIEADRAKAGNKVVLPTINLADFAKAK